MKTITANDGKTYYLPQNPVWRTGFPDKPGWYPASNFKRIFRLRFFDGKSFGFDLGPENSEFIAGLYVDKPDTSKQGIYWADPWWTPSAQETIKKGEL
jgi:hypothetical protein